MLKGVKEGAIQMAVDYWLNQVIRDLKLEIYWMEPIIVTQGTQTGKYNSSHLTGYAADLHCNNSKDRYELLICLLDVGFNRIGIGNTFIHVDSDPEKTTNVIWTY